MPIRSWSRSGSRVWRKRTEQRREGKGQERASLRLSRNWPELINVRVAHFLRRRFVSEDVNRLSILAHSVLALVIEMAWKFRYSARVYRGPTATSRFCEFIQSLNDGASCRRESRLRAKLQAWVLVL